MSQHRYFFSPLINSLMNPRDYSKSGTNARKPSKKKKQEILLLLSCLAAVSSVVDKSLRDGRVFFWEGYPGNGISKVLLHHFVGSVAGLLEVAKKLCSLEQTCSAI